MSQVESFLPVAGEQVKVLVLGSMPGVRSLAKSQYYAHAQNCFWKIMGELFHFDYEAPYAERLVQLKSRQIALWDVLAHCERRGSLDNSIVVSTEVPNDIGALLAAHSELDCLVFNGKRAAQSFRRHLSVQLEKDLKTIQQHCLPSTSPANAKPGYDEKLAAWREAFSSMGIL